MNFRIFIKSEDSIASWTTITLSRKVLPNPWLRTFTSVQNTLPFLKSSCKRSCACYFRNTHFLSLPFQVIALLTNMASYSHRRGNMASYSHRRGNMASYSHRRGNMASYSHRRGNMASYSHRRGNMASYSHRRGNLVLNEITQLRGPFS
jgi:hypothetical protein